MKHIFISAGEPSGDLHAAAVMRHLPGHWWSGIGGDAMILAGLQPLRHLRETAVLGFSEVFLEYARLRRIFYESCYFLRREKPNLLVLVDYPGFNLRLASYAKSIGIPVLYYIAPKAWAWGEGRVKKMAKTIDRLAVLFPFEVEWFGARGLRATYVGHPLMELRPAVPQRETFFNSLGLAPGARVLGLFPGSRPQEVARMMAPMAAAAEKLIEKKLFDAAVVARAPAIPEALLTREFSGNRFRVYAGDMHPLQASADFLIVKSGTANLESALAGTPMAVIYRTSFLTYFIGRRLVRVKYLNPVNLLCGEEVVPELIQQAATPDHMALVVSNLMGDPSRMAAMRQAFLSLRQQLGEKRASVEVAAIIEEMIRG